MRLSEHEAWNEILCGVKAGCVPTYACGIPGCNLEHDNEGLCQTIRSMLDMSLITKATYEAMKTRVWERVRRVRRQGIYNAYLADPHDWPARIPHIEAFARATKPKGKK